MTDDCDISRVCFQGFPCFHIYMPPDLSYDVSLSSGRDVENSLTSTVMFEDPRLHSVVPAELTAARPPLPF